MVSSIARVNEGDGKAGKRFFQNPYFCHTVEFDHEDVKYPSYPSQATSRLQVVNFYIP